MEVTTELSTCREIEAPKVTLKKVVGTQIWVSGLASEGLTSAQIQVPEMESEERVGAQIQEPETMTSLCPVVSSSTTVRDINGLSSSVVTNLGIIYRIGPQGQAELVAAISSL